MYFSWGARARQSQSASGSGHNTNVGGDAYTRSIVADTIHAHFHGRPTGQISLTYTDLQQIIAEAIDVQTSRYESWLAQAERDASRLLAERDEVVQAATELSEHVGRLERAAQNRRSRRKAVAGLSIGALVVATAFGSWVDDKLGAGARPPDRAAAGDEPRQADSESATTTVEALENAAEASARQYLALAEADNVDAMWAMTTETYRAGDPPGSFEAFAAYWGPRVLDLQYGVSLGEPPTVDEVSSAAWVQVAYRTLYRRDDGSEARDTEFGVFWWQFIEEGGVYKLHDVKRAVRPTCPPDEILECTRGNRVPVG